MVAAIDQGYPQREIERSAYEYQQKIESGEQVIVGVNQFTSNDAKAPPVMKIDPKGERAQCERLKALRSSRDSKAAQAALSAVNDAAKDGSNLMPKIVEAVRKRCTLGEISDVLRGVFGEYRGNSGI